MSTTPDISERLSAILNYGDYDRELVGDLDYDSYDEEDDDGDSWPSNSDDGEEIDSDEHSYSGYDSEESDGERTDEDETESDEDDDDDDDDGFPFAVINAFTFCKPHGNEFCNKCHVDYRLGNNDKVPQKMYREYAQKYWPGVKPDDRPPIRDVFKLARACTNGEYHPKTGWALYTCCCYDRHSTDCTDCFNWLEYMKDEVTRPKGDVGTGQLYSLLDSVGVWLSRVSTLSWQSVILEKKLSDALATAQGLTSLSPSSINPSKLSLWQENVSKKASSVMYPRSGQQMLNAIFGSSEDETATKASAFKDLCSTVAELAKNFEAGRKSLIIRDSDDCECICIHILGIHHLDDKRPLVSLIYQDAIFSEPTGVKNIRGFMEKMIEGGFLIQIRAVFMNRPCSANCSQITQSSFPQSTGPRRRTLKSHLRPQVSTLRHNDGCKECGKPATTRCSQCQFVWYCSRACQKSAWADHKEHCTYMKGATWVSVKISTSVNIQGEKKRIGYISADQSLEIGEDGPPLNIYTDKPFAVKLQRQLKADEVDRKLPGNVQINEEKCMLVYDYPKSVRGYVMESENVEVYQKVLDAMMTGEDTRKMYRWATRVGDYELKVCVDRDPDFGEREQSWW
ncbi:hypothetical protein BDZ89DRAFT_1080548 [Hymenopellis radicata]|nr:hypothetical protein BDZ89DRAFT_1080548 [Hymenopellis radicata]